MLFFLCLTAGFFFCDEITHTSSIFKIVLILLIFLPLSQIHQTWRQLMKVRSLVATSWHPGVRCLLAFNQVDPQFVACSHASSASSAPDTCRAYGGTTGTATMARSSSSAKTAPFSPAASEENERPSIDVLCCILRHC